MNALPMLGNLAWAPVPAVESVEVLDRFNGVPTFGLFSSRGQRQLFWRVTGYVPQSFSIWLYIPLAAAVRRSAIRHRGHSQGLPPDLEREWQLPEDVEPQPLVRGLVTFLLDALRIMLTEDMPPARRDLVFTMSQAVEELVAA
jgi:hypothetical protein